jgi:peptidyl-tRNA hydrolase, PTH1 family
MVDEPQILLVVGLGNPGSRYAHTWHNLGFLVLDYWSEEKGLTFKPGRGDFEDLTVKSRKGLINFIKPTSYMNLSGIPTRQVLKRNHLLPENILVICDDIALPFGSLRVRSRGSDGGHNGLASIITELGSEDFARMRLGIQTPNRQPDLADYVLSRIPSNLNDKLKAYLKISSEALNCILHRGLTTAMNRFNRNLFDLQPETEVQIPQNDIEKDR